MLKLLLICSILTSCAHGLNYYRPLTYPDITDPGEIYKCCDSATTYEKLFICDPDRVLLPTQVANIQRTLGEFSKKTGCICETCTANQTGVKAYVAIAKSIYKDYQQSKEEALIKMADTVRRDWSIEECNDDLLLFLVENDKMLYASQGKRTKLYLGPEYVNKTIASLSNTNPYTLLSEVITKFRNKIQNVQAELNKPTEAPPNKAGMMVGGITGGVVALILIIILVVVFIKSGKMREGRLGSIRGNQRAKTDPEIRIRQTGSEYEPVQTYDPDEKHQTKLQDHPTINTEEQKAKKSEPSKKDSPKSNKSDTETDKKLESFTPPPPPSSPPPADSEV